MPRRGGQRLRQADGWDVPVPQPGGALAWRRVPEGGPGRAGPGALVLNSRIVAPRRPLAPVCRATPSAGRLGAPGRRSGAHAAYRVRKGLPLTRAPAFWPCPLPQYANTNGNGSHWPPTNGNSAWPSAAGNAVAHNGLLGNGADMPPAHVRVFTMPLTPGCASPDSAPAHAPLQALRRFSLVTRQSCQHWCVCGVVLTLPIPTSPDAAPHPGAARRRAQLARLVTAHRAGRVPILLQQPNGREPMGAAPGAGLPDGNTLVLGLHSCELVVWSGIGGRYRCCGATAPVCLQASLEHGTGGANMLLL